MSITRASFPIVSRVQTGLSTTPTQSMPPSSHPSTGKPKLLDQLREALRSRHYSRRTEQTYCHVLDRPIGDLGAVIRARNPTRLPVLMARDEVKAVLSNLSGDKWLMASLTTMIYTHVLNRGPSGVRSPVDGL